MKKTALFFATILFLSSGSFSQELGVRFGNTTNGHVAIDGVFGLAQFSRIHADVSFDDNGVGVDALWDFIYQSLPGETFKWYAGVGPFFSFQDPFLFGVAGELGLEYHFNSIPISVSGDWRPEFLIVDDTDFSADGFGLNIRFVFK